MQNVVFLFVVLLNIIQGFIVPKLLLPYYDQIKVNYTIHAEQGCYTWKSLNPRIASVVPIKDGHQTECSQSAVVYVESTSPSKKTTLLLAESKLTGIILQCDVIIDRIYAIDIISRTRELYLEDPPETLKIRALDSEDNTFSSTAGMTFDWSLLQDSEHDSGQPIMLAHTILSIIKFIDTMYNAEWYVEQLEKEGKQPDTILLSGLQTGTAYVSAKLTSMSDISSTKIKMTVRDKVFLNPSGDVWIQQYALLKYSVEQWRKGRPSHIKMPSSQYFLQLTEGDNHVVTLDQQTSTVVGQNVGHSQIKLMDKNLKQHHTLQAYSDIYVSEPAYLMFTILPDNKWVLECGKNYILLIQVFDNNNNLLWSSNNIRIVADISDTNLKVLDSSTNGTWYNIDAVKAGKLELYAKLNGIIKQDGSTKTYHPVIETTQLVEIFDPIKVDPSIVIFPWQPEPVLYKYQLTAKGGSGNYSWMIEDNSVVMVSNMGMVMTKMDTGSLKSHTVGSTTVFATDVRNFAHWGSSEVFVLPVLNILFACSKREAEIGSYLNIFLTMNAEVEKELVPVVDCRESKVLWTIEDPTVFEISDDLFYREDLDKTEFACTGKRLKALREGYTTITAKYTQYDMDGKTRKLQATTTIAAFPALRALDPQTLAVVSLGSSKLMKFIGGPILWPLWHAGYERIGKADDTNLIKVSLVTSFQQQQHHLIITCYGLGTTLVSLLVHNKPCNTNPLPVQSDVVVKVLCAVPARIEISVPVLLPSCPLHNTHSVQTVSLVNHVLPLNVTAFDVHGNMFDNFSSIHIDWSSDYPNTTFNEQSSSFDYFDSLEQNKHIVHKFASLLSHEGELTIDVSLNKYNSFADSKICKLDDCKFIGSKVNGSIRVLVVQESSLFPSNLHLYNHINSTIDVQISGGSGYFFHKIQQEHNIASVVQEKHNILRVSTVNGGKAQLHIIDHCIAGDASTSADIKISQIANLNLKVVPRMELGSWSKATVQILDQFGQEVPTRFLTFINVQVITNPDNIIMSNKPYASSSESLVVVTDIKAQNVGVTSMTVFISTRDGKKLVSNAVRINVFPVLELIPSIVTLIQHASYQLLVKGGPRSDFNIEFLLSDENENKFANISQSGLVHGLKVGSVMASVRAIMHNGIIFNCKAPSKIEVVQLTGVRIVAPLTRLHVGGFAPLHVTEITDDSRNPLSFGNTVPGLLFEWKVANPAVVKLESVHAQAGIQTTDALSFSKIAQGLSAGHCSISVTVTATDNSLNQLSKEEFFAEVSFMVFEPLKLSSSTQKNWSSINSLLMTLSSSHIIKTNRDSVAQSIIYQVLPSQGCENNHQTGSTMCVDADDQGFVMSKSSQCEATILVTSVEGFGVNQTLALHVLVRPVSYVIARATTHFRVKNSPIQFFPLSSTINFVVEQFDDTGKKFDSSSHNLALFQNRHDLIELEPKSGNHSFVVHTPLEGTTVVSVSCHLDENLTPSIAFYFPIHVAHSIQPREFPLIVGLKYCFTSAFLNNDGSIGEWSTSDSLLILNKNTGSAISLSKKPAQITYKVDTFKANMQVKSKPYLAAFNQEKLPSYISSDNFEYILPITILQKSTERKICDDILEKRDNIALKLFQCNVKLRRFPHVNLFEITTKYISTIDSYACVLSRNLSCGYDDSKIAVIDDNVLVTLKETSHDVGLVSGGEASFSFMPRFIVEISSDKLEPGAHVNLCVKSSPKMQVALKVTPVNNKVLKIEEPTKDIYNNPCYMISIQTDDLTTLTSGVRVLNSYTLQDEVVELTLVRRGVAMSQSSCLPPSSWMKEGDKLVDGYLAYINTTAVVVISTAILIVAFGFFKWVTSNTVNPPSTSFLLQTPPPYNPINSPYPAASSTLNTSNSSETPKMRLWSRYYEPQQPGLKTG